MVSLFSNVKSSSRTDGNNQLYSPKPVWLRGTTGTNVQQAEIRHSDRGQWKHPNNKPLNPSVIIFDRQVSEGKGDTQRTFCSMLLLSALGLFKKCWAVFGKPGSEHLKPLHQQTDCWCLIYHIINSIIYKSLYNQIEKGEHICPASQAFMETV